MGHNRSLSRLVRQSGLYALGNVAIKLSGLLLAPLYLNTAYLSVSDYSDLALLLVTSQLGIFALGLGLASGLLKFMSDPAYEDDYASLPFTALVATAAIALLVLAALWVSAGAVARLLLGEASEALAVRLLGVYVVLKVIGGIPRTVLRVRERAGVYAFTVAAEVVLLIGGVYYALAVRSLGVAGIMGAFAVSAGVGSGVLVGVHLARSEKRFQWRLVRPLMHYGLPLVVASLASWVLNAGDRYLLGWLSTDEMLARYDWAARLGGVLNVLFVQSFQLAFSVLGLKALGAGDVSLHRRTFRHYAIWTGWLVLGLSLLSYDLMNVLVVYLGVDPFYLEADPLVFPIALGFMAYGIYVVINNVLYADGRTRAISGNVAIAAVLNVALNIALIPWLGAYGAAITTVLAYATLVGLTAWLAREKQVSYEWRVLAVVLGLVAGLYAAGTLTVAWPTLLRLSARIGIIACYVPLLLVLRVYRTHELQGLWEGAKRQWSLQQ